MSKAADIEIRNAVLGYGSRKVLTVSALKLAAGQIHCIFGRNGCGKTTFLKSVGGLLPLREGSVKIGDVPLQRMTAGERARILSVVLTHTPFIASMTVHDFISFGRYPYTNWLGNLAPEDEEVIEMALQTCGLSAMRQRQMSEISDGEMQKVQIARALAQDTGVLLLDEPVAHLDLVNKADIFHILKQIGKDGAKTIVFSSHDVQFAMQLSHTFVVAGEGGLRSMPAEVFRSGKVYEEVLSSPYLQIGSKDGAVLFKDPD